MPEVFRWSCATDVDPAWLRAPPMPAPERVFQVVEIASDPFASPPEVHIFAASAEGRSALVRVPVQPYYYVALSERGNDRELNDLIERIEREARSSLQNRDADVAQLVTAGQVVSMRSIMYYGTPYTPHAKLTFATPSVATAVRGYLVRNGYQLYDADLKLHEQLLFDLHLKGCVWIELPDTAQPLDASDTTCSYVFSCLPEDIKVHGSAGRWMAMAPMRVLSYDIECMSDRGFPTPAHSKVIQISAILSLYNDTDHPLANVLFALDSVDPIEGTDVRCFTDEREMLEAFAAMVRACDPDVITGYNILNFDFPFLLDRAAHLRCENFARLGRTSRPATHRETKFQSKAVGVRVEHKVEIAGRVLYDMLKTAQRTMSLKNLPSLTLNKVSKVTLNEQKEDVHHSQIPILQRGDASTRRRLGVYCVKDSILPLRMMTKLKSFVNDIGMTRVCGIPLSYIFRGDSLKCMFCVIEAAKAKNMGMPFRDREAGVLDESYDGATVFEPTPGFYRDPIATLDYSSLYPSLMMSENYCYTTLIPADRAGSVPGAKKSPAGFWFATDQRGLLPEIEDGLLAARKQAKEMMGATKDPFEQAVYDGLQLAVKTIMNTMYGATGAKTGRLPCIPISSSITAAGRERIEWTKKWVEERYTIANGYPGNAKVLYGDSVPGDTPVVVRYGGTISVRRIDELAETDWIGYHDDKECAGTSAEVWTERGWTEVRKVIRHNVPATKRVIEVVTHTGATRATADHSFLNPKAEKISGSALSLGDEVLSSALPSASETISMDDREAWLMGFFMADGSAGVYKCPSGGKSTWRITKQNMEALEYAKECAELVYPKTTFRIYDTMRSSAVHSLTATNAKSIAELYGKIFYDKDRRKRVPDCILNANRSARESFWKGYYTGDGDKDAHGYIRFDMRGRVGSAGMYQLVSSLGYSASVNVRSDKPDIYRITICRAGQIQRKAANAIKKIREIPHNGMVVYDLETENHHFQAGVGQIVVHNTDSVMVLWGEGVDRATAMRLGAEAAKEISKELIRPMNLEFEKVYDPYLLVGKKRYAAYKCTPDGKVALDIKGLESQRRDNPGFVRDTMKTMITMILDDRNAVRAVQYVRERLADLFNDRVDVSELIITMSLKREAYQYTTASAAVSAHRKMTARDADAAPAPGTRFATVRIQQAKGASKCEGVDDPLEVIRNGTPIDREWYRERCEHALGRILFLFPEVDHGELFRTGPHLRKIVVTMPTNTAFARYFKPKPVCVQCRRDLAPGNRAFCAECLPRSGEIEDLMRVRHAEVAERAGKYRAQCETCTGRPYADIQCAATDCDNFYRRTLAGMALDKQRALLERVEQRS